MEVKCYNKNIEPNKALIERYGIEGAYFILNLLDNNTGKKWQGNNTLTFVDGILSNGTDNWNIDALIKEKMDILPKTANKAEPLTNEASEDDASEREVEYEDIGITQEQIQEATIFGKQNELIDALYESQYFEKRTIVIADIKNPEMKAHFKKLTTEPTIERYVDLREKGEEAIVWQRVTDDQTITFNKTPNSKEVNEKSEIDRNTGTILHAYIQNLMEGIIMSDTALYPDITLDKRRRDEWKPMEVPKMSNGKTKIIDAKMVKKLQEVVHKILKRVQDNGGGIVFTEQFVLDTKDIFVDKKKQDKSIGGSIDILVVHPDKSVSVFDYKFIDAWKGFDENGKSIFVDKIVGTKDTVYNKQIGAYINTLKKHGVKVKDSLIVPISRTQSSYTREKVWKIGISKKAGDELDFKPMAYMPPKSDELTALLNKLYEQKDILSKDPSDEALQQLEDIKKTIQALVVNDDITFLLDSIESLTNLFTAKLSELGEAEGDLAILQSYQSLLSVYDELYKDTLNHYKESTPEIRAKIEKLQRDIKVTAFLLREKELQTIQTQSREKGVDENLVDSPQKELTWLQRVYRTLTDFTNPVFRMFSKTLNQAESKIYQAVIKVDNELDKFNSLTFADFNSIINPTTQNLNSRMDAKFYEEKDNARKTRDTKWFEDNFKFSQAKFDKALKKQTEWLEIRYEGEELERRIALFITNNNPTIDTDAYFNPFTDRFIDYENKEFLDKWTSDFYKKLQTKGGLLLEFYDYYQSKIDEYREILSDSGVKLAPGFIAFIRKELMESVAYGKVGFRNLVLDAIEIQENDEQFGNQETDKVPILYTSGGKIDKEGNIIPFDKSFDLAKSLLLFTKAVYSYKHKKEIEPAVIALRHAMEKQKTLKTNTWWKPIKNLLGEDKASEGNVNNINTFERYVRMYIYGQQLQGKDRVFDLFGTKVSGNKAIQTAQRYMAIKDLGWNPLAAIVNAVSNRFNAFMYGGEERDYSNPQFLAATKLALTDTQLYYAITEWLDINKSIEYKANQKSKLFFNKDKFLNNPMGLMQEPEEALRRSISVAFLSNHSYNAETKKLERIIGKDKSKSVIKGLKTKRTETGIEVIYENGGTSLPLDKLMDNEDFFNYREKTLKLLSKITGTVSLQDKALYRTYIWGQVFMQYRNWIPRVVQSRFGNMRYDNTMEEYELGRYRMLVDTIATKWKSTLFNFGSVLAHSVVRSISLGYIKVTPDLKARNSEAYKYLYEKYKQENPNLTQEEFNELIEAKEKALAIELQMLTYILLLLQTIVSGFEDDKDEWWYKQNMKMLNKLQDELMFNYDPKSIQDIMKEPFPMFRVAKEVMGFVVNTGDELIRDPIWGENSARDLTPLGYHTIQFIPIANILYKMTVVSDLFDNPVKKDDTLIQIVR